MTPTKLQAARRLLFLSVVEAARFVTAPEVTEKQWQSWESGDASIPDDVAQRITELLEWRSNALAATAESIRQQIRNQGGVPETILILWYERFDDWMSLPDREAVMWRVQQSVCASLLDMFSTVVPVPFDRAVYDRWLDGREDSEALRAKWASQQ